MTKFRSAMLTTAFAAVVAAALTGSSLRGETHEVNVAETCARAAWPEIPAGCLEGGPGQTVRFVTANMPAIDAAMEARFETAFN